MITGGAGFIGSNLAHRLVDLGAERPAGRLPHPGLRRQPLQHPGHRGPGPGEHRRRAPGKHDELPGARHVDVIFNLAGQVSHIDSMRDPYTDLEINCRSQLSILEACRRNNPGVKVVFAGTRQVYGKPEFLPVTEQHLVRPTDVNGINKVAGEYYHLVYNNVFGVRACSLRLTNIYGPRQLVKHNRQGFIGWFIRLAVEGRETADLRRRLAAARLRVRRRCGRRVPEGGGVRRVQRRGVQRRRQRSRSAIATSCICCSRWRAPGACATWSGPQSRRRSTSAASTPTPAKFRTATGWQPRVGASRGAGPDRRLLPASTCPTTWSPETPGRRLHHDHTSASPSCVLSLERIVRPSTPPSGASSSADGTCSVRKSTPSSAASPRACGAAHAVGVGTGTDAIAIILRGLGLGPGDEVITTPVSAAYTALACMMVGRDGRCSPTSIRAA